MSSPVALLAAVLVKNASVKAGADAGVAPPAAHTKPEVAVKPFRQGNAVATIKSNPVKSLALMLGTAGAGYFGGKHLLGGQSLADEVDRSGHHPAVQALAAGSEVPGKVIDRVMDPFKGVGGADPNSAPAPAKPGMVDTYLKNLKSGDPAALAGTGAAALLAGVLTHNLLKKRSKR